jgi:hypothetical protein
MKTNLLHYSSLIYFVSQPLPVSGVFIAHHQEVFTVHVRQLVRVVIYIYINLPSQYKIYICILPPECKLHKMYDSHDTEPIFPYTVLPNGVCKWRHIVILWGVNWGFKHKSHKHQTSDLAFVSIDMKESLLHLEYCESRAATDASETSCGRPTYWRFSCGFPLSVKAKFVSKFTAALYNSTNVVNKIVLT